MSDGHRRLVVAADRGRLRIGLVCPYSMDTPGGVQNHVLGLARYLLDRGHEPFILAPGQLADEPENAVLVDRFTSAGPSIPVRYNGSVARINYGPISAHRVRCWLQTTPLDVVHLHEPITPSISILALTAAQIPVIATFHTATPRSRTMQLAGLVIGPAIDRIQARIAVSESAREVVVRHLGRDAVVIPNGISCAHFNTSEPSARTKTGAGSRPRRVLFIGRVDERRKGFDVLRAAAPLIRRSIPALEIVVAGQGARPLPPGFVDVGTVGEAEKARLLRGADCFIAPHGERESFGIVIVEAMASGTPVAASAIDAFSDVLSGQLGARFEVGNPAALAEAVIDVLTRPDPLRTARARRAAWAYDWETVGARVLEVYHQTLGLADPEVSFPSPAPLGGGEVWPGPITLAE